MSTQNSRNVQVTVYTQQMLPLYDFVLYEALSHVLSHLIPTKILSGKYYCLPFTDEETGAQTITNPR